MVKTIDWHRFELPWRQSCKFASDFPAPICLSKISATQSIRKSSKALHLQSLSFANFSNHFKPFSSVTTFIMSGMVANLAIILGAMQVSKRIDWEDPTVLTNIRLMYLASNVIMFSIFAYIYLQIQKKAGIRPVLSRSL